MTKTLAHKGYIGSVEISLEDGCLHGRIQFVEDVITYEGETVVSLRSSFEDAVDRYLAHCRAVGKKPDRPCSGTFNVRLGPELHKRAAVTAVQAGATLNDFVVKAVLAAVQPPDKRVVVHERHVVGDDLQPVGQREASTRLGHLKWERHGLH